MGNPTISVSLLKSIEIDFILNGEFKVSNSAEVLLGKCLAKTDGEKLIIQNFDKSISGNEFLLIPVSNSFSFTIKDVVIGVSFHWEQKETQKFKGALKLIIEDNKVTAVNIIDVEEYLKSVISSEMSSTSSLELLKAHAIVSRSWLFAQIRNKLQEINITEEQSENEIIKIYDRSDHKNYDFCNDDHCQRYQGITKVYSENVEKAIEATKGMVLKYGDEICDARFSKSCGGISESFENVWQNKSFEYLSSIIDYKFPPDEFETDLRKEENARKWILNSPSAFCNTDDESILSQVLLDYDQSTKDFYRWKVSYTQDELSKLVKDKSGIDFGKIIDLIPVERGYSGRLTRLKIVGEKKTLTVGKELEIRRILSHTHLYSSAFIIEKIEGQDSSYVQFNLIGAGWGHGVGMCQIGAAVMGAMGYSFDEILTHYFKNTNIKKIY